MSEVRSPPEEGCFWHRKTSSTVLQTIPSRNFSTIRQPVDALLLFRHLRLWLSLEDRWALLISYIIISGMNSSKDRSAYHKINNLTKLDFIYKVMVLRRTIKEVSIPEAFYLNPMLIDFRLLKRWRSIILQPSPSSGSTKLSI